VGGGLAHQLRNGVAGARLAIQLHSKGCPGADEDDALGVALRQLALVDSQLKRFLDQGRLDEAPRSCCDVGRMLEEVVSLHLPQCQHARIALWLHGRPDCVVTGSAEQLRDLLHNVIGNAVEAAGPGGSVEIRLRPEGKGYAVEVSDSGPGPDAALADRLFEPFVTGKPDGVGLGLAVARRVARAHGGDVTWQRQGGRTCFRIELPAEGGA
jgi:signal transduction histidine kinase